jgi:GTPase
VPYRVVALVGYTNAGKSTLFNGLTQAKVQAVDMLFATLDPTLRQIRLPHGGHAVLSDTVGFVSDLPTMLVAAFRATLEEVVEADLILHVRDISHADTEAQRADVEGVLHQLGIATGAGDRIIEVWNKIDRLDADERPRLANAAARHPHHHRALLVSAATGEGVDQLVAAIEERLAADKVGLRVTLDAADGAAMSWLYRHTEVLSREADDEAHVAMTVRAEQTQRALVMRRFEGRVEEVAL